MSPRACSQVLRSTRLIRSVVRASNLSVIKLIEILILWVYYTIPFGFSLFRPFFGYHFSTLKFFFVVGLNSIY